MFLKPEYPVTVNLFSDHTSKVNYPKSFVYNGQTFPVKQINLHQVFKSGQTLYHTFCITSEDDSFFRLILDTETLSWTLDEIADKREG